MRQIRTLRHFSAFLLTVILLVPCIARGAEADEPVADTYSGDRGEAHFGRYQITGHEYFYFHPLVTADLVALLSSGAHAAERSGLQAQMRDGVRYWEFKEAIQDEDSASTVAD